MTGGKTSADAEDCVYTYRKVHLPFSSYLICFTWIFPCPQPRKDAPIPGCISTPALVFTLPIVVHLPSLPPFQRVAVVISGLWMRKSTQKFGNSLMSELVGSEGRKPSLILHLSPPYVGFFSAKKPQQLPRRAEPGSVPVSVWLEKAAFSDCAACSWCFCRQDVSLGQGV